MVFLPAVTFYYNPIVTELKEDSTLQWQSIFLNEDIKVWLCCENNDGRNSWDFSLEFFCSLNKIRSDTSTIQTQPPPPKIPDCFSKQKFKNCLQDLCLLSHNHDWLLHLWCSTAAHHTAVLLKAPCRQNCLDCSADRAGSWLSGGTFHVRAKLPFGGGDPSSLPSCKGSCLPCYSRLLPSSLHRHANPLVSQSPAGQEVDVQRTNQWKERSSSAFTRSFLAQWGMWRTLQLLSALLSRWPKGCP